MTGFGATAKTTLIVTIENPEFARRYSLLDMGWRTDVLGTISHDTCRMEVERHTIKVKGGLPVVEVTLTSPHTGNDFARTEKFLAGVTSWVNRCIKGEPSKRQRKSRKTPVPVAV